jgi:hypothetical protein
MRSKVFWLVGLFVGGVGCAFFFWRSENASSGKGSVPDQLVGQGVRIAGLDLTAKELRRNAKAIRDIEELGIRVLEKRQLGKDVFRKDLLAKALAFARERGVDPTVRLSVNWKLSLIIRWRDKIDKLKKVLQGKERGVDFNTGKIVDVKKEEDYQSTYLALYSYRRDIEALKSERYFVLKDKAWGDGQFVTSLVLDLNEILKGHYAVLIQPSSVPFEGKYATLLLIAEVNPVVEKMRKDLMEASYLEDRRAGFERFNGLPLSKRKKLYRDFYKKKVWVDDIYRAYHEKTLKVTSELKKKLRRVEADKTYVLFKSGKKYFDRDKYRFVVD